MTGHILGGLLVAGIVAAAAYAAWCEWLLSADDRRDLRRVGGRVSYDRRVDPPRFTRDDPSPTPRRAS